MCRGEDRFGKQIDTVREEDRAVGIVVNELLKRIGDIGFSVSRNIIGGNDIAKVRCNHNESFLHRTSMGVMFSIVIQYFESAHAPSQFRFSSQSHN